MKQYIELVKDVLYNGIKTNDRTGVGTKSVFGRQMKFDLINGFPLVTTKKLYYKGAFDEILWMLSGSTVIDDLPKRTRHIWDQEEWHVNNYGDIGPSYGQQFRSIPDPHKPYMDFDQIDYLVNNIKENPDSRRHVLSLWNQPYMDRTALPCCHSTVLQFRVDGNYLDCNMYARSQDVALGMPFNIAQYALLTHMMAKETGYKPGTYTHMTGDTHIYLNHVNKLKKQVQREPKSLPILELGDFDYFDIPSNPKEIKKIVDEDINVKHYNHHPSVEYEIAV